MTGIHIFLEMVEDDSFIDQQTKNKLTQNAIKQLEHIIHLTDEIVETIKLKSGKMEYEPENLSTRNLMEETFLCFSTIAERKRIDFEVTCADDIPDIYGDPTRTREIINNVVGNSLKFCPPGASSTFTASQQDNFILFQVSDNGPGISPEESASIFDKFKSGETKPTGNEKSSGLGLYIVKKLVEQQGGEIKVASQKGKGSIFSFTLPLCSKTSL